MPGQSTYAQRRQRLAERLRRRNLDAWILVPGPNLRYLTGLGGQARERVFLYCEPANGTPFAVVPHFEAGRVREAMADVDGLRVLTYRDEAGPDPAIARAFAPFGGRGAAFGAEFRVMRLFERVAVEGAVPRARWHDIEQDTTALRQVKDPDEAAAIRRAAHVARAAVEAGWQAARPGVTERQVAAACRAVLERHLTESWFGVQVASGPRSADPHAETADRVLESGDICWIDLGSLADGYCADITRSFIVGDAEAAPPEVRRALEVVRTAQSAAIAAISPGVTAAQVDAAARTAIAEAGLGAYFTHRTGHGLGLEGHEAPYIVDGNEEPLLPGMVFTVEPGVYIPGKGGVRIEDDVLLTDRGVEVLTGGD